jgi:tetratricopeptide (TPR) repeat protein
MKLTSWLFILFLTGCTAGPSVTVPPTTVPNLSATAASEPAATPTLTIRLTEADVFCPTQNQQAEAAYNSGLDLTAQDRTDEAKTQYLKAIQLDPAFCDAMDNLGVLYRREGNLDQAIYWYQQSIAAFPDNPIAHQDLALAYQLQGKIDEALAEYQQLVQIDANNPEGYYGLGNIYLHQNQPDKAIEQLKQAETLYLKQSSPLVSDARFLIGLAYVNQQQCTQGRDYLEPLYTEFQDEPSMNYYLGVCLATSEPKDLDRARTYLTHAQELGWNVPAEVMQLVNP